MECAFPVFIVFSILELQNHLSLQNCDSSKDAQKNFWSPVGGDYKIFGEEPNTDYCVRTFIDSCKWFLILALVGMNIEKNDKKLLVIRNKRNTDMCC